jgi:hypothetical protein
MQVQTATLATMVKSALLEAAIVHDIKSGKVRPTGWLGFIPYDLEIGHLPFLRNSSEIVAASDSARRHCGVGQEDPRAIAESEQQAIKQKKPEQREEPRKSRNGEFTTRARPRVSEFARINVVDDESAEREE